MRIERITINVDQNLETSDMNILRFTRLSGLRKKLDVGNQATVSFGRDATNQGGNTNAQND